MSQTKYRIEKKKAGGAVKVKNFTKREMAWWKEDERRPVHYNIWAHEEGKSICAEAEKEALAAYLLEHPKTSKKVLNAKSLGWRARIRKELFALQPDDVQTRYRLIAECAEPRTEAEM